MRILSATHKNLAALVADGRFREDLFYRMNVIELRVPPLRERLEDIDELVSRSWTAWPADRQPLVASDRSAMPRCASIIPRQRARAGEHPGARGNAVSTGIDAGDLQLRPKVASTDVPIPNTVEPGEQLGTRWKTSSATRSSARWNRPATTRPRPRSCSA